MNLAGVAYVVKRRKGKPLIHYYYAWRGGPQIMRVEGGPKPRLTPAAIAAYQAAHAKRLTAPGDTLAGLATGWRDSPEWQALAPTTRNEWGRCLSEIEARFGKAPLGAVDDRRFRADIMAWRKGMADTPRKADYHITVLKALLSWGRVQGQLALNVADGIPQLYKGGNRAGIVWTPDDIALLRPVLPVQLQDALDLARLSGLRRGDLVKLPLSAFGPHAIVWRTSKSNGERVVTVPMLPELAGLVETLRTRHRAPGIETALVNSRGKPWTVSGLTGTFNAHRDCVGITKRLHDIRGTFCTELCLAGLTDETVAGIMGWSVARVAEIRRVYVDQARTVVAIGEALARK